MANTIMNNILINGDENEIKKLYNHIKRDTEIEKYGVKSIAFNKIELMPKEICELESENGCASESYFRWTDEYWGSKGNAYNFLNKDNKPNNIWFQTSGSHSLKLIKKLSVLFPSLKIQYSWYDDFDLGSYVGECIIENNFSIKERKFENKSKESFEFIFYIEKCTPKEKGLIYNPDVDSYDYED